jgi:Carboxypeptidase regulatory-like domain
MAKQHKSIPFWIIPFLVVFLAAPLQLLAQGGATGALSGDVEDPTGAVIAGAQVQVLNATTGEVVRTETTSSTGLFAFTLLPASTYNVQVSASGFGQMLVRGVEVRVTETTRLPISLKAKVGTQTVEVQSEAENIETTAATTGNSLGGTAIRELPLATRNFQQLLALSAGASSSLNAAAQLGRGDVRIQVNGGREDDNNYQIDGIGANDSTNQGELAFSPLPSPDSIQEFKVATSLYDATQGRNGGGNINAILKSGTKSVHFDAFEYFRNTDLNANDFFLKGYGLDRPVIKQNIFGGSVGGPIGPDAKLGFFFFNYQGTRQQSGDSPGAIISTNIPYVPLADRSSMSALATDFGVPAVDPMAFALLSRQSNQFGPGAGNYLFPLPAVAPGTAAGALVPFRVSLPGRFTDNQFTANWDRDFHGGKDRLAARFFFSNSETKQPFGGDSFQLLNGGVGLQNNLDFPIDIPLRNRFASLSETHLFTDHLVNDIRFGVNVISYHFRNIDPVTAQDLGINRPTSNVTSDMYRLDFAGIGVQMGPFPSSPMSSLSDGLTLLETLSWVRGNHNFRFGGGFDHSDVRRFNPIDDDGFLFFSPEPSYLPGNPFYSDFQNFLTGNLAPGTLVAGGLGNHDYKIPNFSLFVQDDYRATKTLTVNLGFRVDWNGAPYDALCNQGNFDPNLLATTGQPFFWPKCIDRFNLPGVVGTAQRSGMDNNYTTVLQPRIGFAYDVGGHHTTSIRAGYGIYTVREDIGSLENMILTPPTMPQVAPAGPNPNPGGLATYFSAPPNQVPAIGEINANSIPTPALFSGFNTSPACNGTWTTNTTSSNPCFTGNVTYDFAPQIPRTFISPTMQQWNLTVERSLGRNWTLQLGYFGSKGTHLREVNDANQPVLASPTQPINVTVKDPNSPVFGQTYSITQNTFANVLARSPYLGSAPFGYEKFGQDANSHYHGLDVTVSHRFSKGLNMQSAYTYSKATDDTSTASVAFDTRLNNQLTGVASRGPSDFDRRQRWVTNYDYTLPFFAGRHDFAGRALSGWEFSGVFTLQSGAPFTVIDSAGGAAYGYLSSPNLVTPDFAPGFSCANALTSGSTESRLGGFLNTSAFLPAPVVPNSVTPDNPLGSTGYGDVGRNCFHGPRQLNLDFSVSRTFTFTERQQLKFSAEFFNLTNTPSFGNPAYPVDYESAAGGPTFGKINQVVGTPRLIQFALRYAF